MCKKSTILLLLLTLYGEVYAEARPVNETVRSSTTYSSIGSSARDDLAEGRVVEPDPVKKSVYGIVTDANSGVVLVGCTVLIKGSAQGTTTDQYGQYELKASEGDILEVSYLGYLPREVLVGEASRIDVELVEDSQQVEEVVVTAFGSGQRKESLTGAIQSVNPSDMKMPSSNLSNSFAGRLSGVIAYQRSGEPGNNGSNFYIRGISTLSGITNPLIVMDGVEISSADLNAIDPEIIESFSILKDATATAMYGTRGANGVMIIKTKSGASLERPAISFRVESYVNMPTKIQSFVDGATFMEMFNEAVTNQGTGAVLYSDYQIANTRAGSNKYVFPNVDWYNEIFKETTFNQKANFNIRGGTEKITYFMNMSFNHETGMLKDNSRKYYSYSNNIDLQKYAFQNNIDFHMSKSSTISLHLNTQLNDYRGPYNSVATIFSSIMNTNPIDYPIEYPGREDGNWVHWGSATGANAGTAYTNPMATATSGYQDYFESTVIANLDFDQKLDFITEGLSFKALVSFKNWSYTGRSRSQSATNYYYMSGYTDNGDGTFNYTITPKNTPNQPTLNTATSTSGDRTTYFQTYFNYDRAFGDHYVNGMLLFNMQSYNTNVASDLISSLPQRKMGFAARLSYDYRHRYMIEVNAGYNGSENFAAGHRWGFFPSLSLGWNISQEDFWGSLRNTISNLKLRGSYGLVGNDQIGSDRYIYLGLVTLQSVGYTTGFGNYKQSYYGPSYTRYQNNNISWEVGYKLNVGMDLELLNAINITLEGFQEKRTNIFQRRNSIPNYFGTANTTVYGNLATVKNWGFEMSADVAKQINKDLLVSFKGTFTFARNKILEYDEGSGVRNSLSNIGKRLNTIFGYVADGLYIDEQDIANSAESTISNIAVAPGDVKFLDQPDNDGNYDGVIDPDDRVAMGYPTIPEIVYGFGPSIVYKNWDFSFFFQGAANVSLMMQGSDGFSPFGATYNRNVLSWIADDYWSSNNQNPQAAFPRLTQYNSDHNMAASSFWLRNAAYLKLKNIELGYTYKRARFYVSAMNVFTISPFKLWDPEMGGGAGLSYPTQRTYNIGVQISL